MKNIRQRNIFLLKLLLDNINMQNVLMFLQSTINALFQGLMVEMLKLAPCNGCVYNEKNGTE